MRVVVGLGAVVALVSIARAADFVPSGPEALPRLLGPDAIDDVDRSDVARAVEKRGFWAGDPIGVSQCASCHPDAVAQWSSSAHRFASFNNPYYVNAVELFRKERGFTGSRFCAGCHDPALVSTGRIDAAVDRRTREAQAGIVCLACHSISDHPRRGNGDFTAKLDAWPTSGPAHKARLRPASMATADFCGTCHRVGLTEEVTRLRWLRGQDELYAFLGSSIAGQGAASIHRAPATQRCQDCHMPLEAAPLGDAAAKAGADGIKRIRSHRFLGANTALPHLRGDAAHEARTAGFLKDRVALDLQIAEDGALDVVLRSRGIGHRFPAGTMDSNEVWVEVTAYDARDHVLGRSGALHAVAGQAPTLGKEAHLVRAQMVDRDGEPLRFRDVHHAAGVVHDNSLLPGDPQAVRYELPRGTARATARLLYRKFGAEYARFSCAELPDAATRARCNDQPIVEMAAGAIVVPSAPVSVEEACRASPWDRVVDHGIALAGALVDRAEEARAWLRCAQDREPSRPEPLLGLARLALVLGQTDEVLALTAQAMRLAPAHPAPHYLAVVALVKAYRHGPARRAAETLARMLPDDPNALALLARTRGLDRDPRGALDASQRLLAIDPESEEGHYQASLALAELGRKDDAAREEAIYLARRLATEENLALRGGFRRWHGQLHDESEPVHRHVLLPPDDTAGHELGAR